MRQFLVHVAFLVALPSLCGCSAKVSVSGSEKRDPCTNLPTLMSSVEALALARQCVAFADDAPVFAYSAGDDYGPVPQGRFAEWQIIVSIEGVLSNIYIHGSNPDGGGVVAAHELQPLDGVLPDCESPGLTVADSQPRVDVAAELFSSLGVNLASAAVYHVHSCITSPWSSHFVVWFPQEFCGDCYRSVEFDDDGEVLRTCWSTACLEGQQEYCCEY